MKSFKAKLIIGLVTALLTMSLLAMATCLFVTVGNTACADVSKQVIKIPVSDLLKNEYAPASGFTLQRGGKTFYIPESYYLEVKESNPTPDGGWIVYRINYQGYDFTLFSQSDLLPQTASFGDERDMFPNITLTLTQDCDIDGRTFLSGSALTFLGYCDTPDKIFCVSTYNGDPYFDNIPLSSVQTFTVPYQKQDEQARRLLIEQQNKPAPPAISDGNIAPNTSLALRVVLIIGICIPAIIIMFLLFKPTKQPERYSRTPNRQNADYDEPRRR